MIRSSQLISHMEKDNMSSHSFKWTLDSVGFLLKHRSTPLSTRQLPNMQHFSWACNMWQSARNSFAFFIICPPKWNPMCGYNALINSKPQHPPSQGKVQAFEKIGSFKFPHPLGQNSVQMPYPIVIMPSPKEQLLLLAPVVFNKVCVKTFQYMSRDPL